MNNEPGNKVDDNEWEFPSRVSQEAATESVKRLRVNYPILKYLAQELIKDIELKPESEMLVDMIKKLSEEIGFDIGRCRSYLGD